MSEQGETPIDVQAILTTLGNRIGALEVDKAVLTYQLQLLQEQTTKPIPQSPPTKER